MSRFKRVIHSVASGYAVLVVVALYSLASVPLALHYLTKPEFALWALMSTIGGYLSLIDLGMSGSVARLLIDHKDNPNDGIYGSLIKTGWLVLSVQGTIIFLASYFLAPLFAVWFKIPAELETNFISLLRWQSSIWALGFFIRIFSHLLHAHQRFDIINYGQIGMMIVNFISLWFFFAHGHNIFSLVWANLTASIGNVIILLSACGALKLFPDAGKWGIVSWQRFKELFAYGKDLFFVSLGTQLILASQILIITRVLGLEAATLWNVSTKVFNLICQAIWRISDFSAPAFSEMLTRKESSTLRERYKSVVILTASLSGFAAVSFALCNSLFVFIWTSGEKQIVWPAMNDVLLGIWMILLAVQHCHSGFVLLTKKIQFMRYVYFIEGVVFISLAALTASRGGLPAIILASILCNAIFSGAYSVWRICRYFELSAFEVAVSWMKPMGKVLLFFVPVALAGWWLGQFMPDRPRLVFYVVFCSSVGSFFFLRFGLPASFHHELLRRAPQTVTPLLRFVFGNVRERIA